MNSSWKCSDVWRKYMRGCVGLEYIFRDVVIERWIIEIRYEDDAQEYEW